MLTNDILNQMWPNGDSVTPGLRAAIVKAAPDIFDKYGLSSDLIVAHAMAQFSEECGAGTELVENLNYSAQGLISTWPTRFNSTTAAQCARNPERIANEVYDGRLGNQANSDDGWIFRGRGGSQCTGRGSYASLGTKIGQDLISTPDLINDPQHFLESAVADFVICGCLPFAANDDISGVTYHLNGGYIGLADRTIWLAKWKAALNVTTDHGTLWVQQSLNKLGAEPPITADGSFGPVTAAAVKAFQQAHGLSADGKIGPLTITAIEQALPA